MPAYVRDVNYLSPSSLAMFEQNPIEFYFQRLGPKEFAPKREPQNLPLAAGIAFDSVVKAEVARRAKLACPTVDYMLRDVTFDRMASIELGSTLLKGYRESGALAALLKDKPTALALTIDDFAPGTKVPIQGKLDGVLAKRVPHDWKVKGAAKPGEYSPAQGYDRLWDSDTGEDNGPHKKADLPLEAIDPEWATQLAMYGWLLGCSPKKPMQGSIDQLIVGRDGRVRVAQFRKTISVEFQARLLERLEKAWAAIKEQRVVPDHDIETLQAIR